MKDVVVKPRTGRSFGFVTFVSGKGARFCMKEAGDPPRAASQSLRLPTFIANW